MTKTNFFKKLDKIITKKQIKRVDEFAKDDYFIIRLENKSGRDFLRIRVNFENGNVKKFLYNYSNVSPSIGLKWIKEDVLLD